MDLESKLSITGATSGAATGGFQFNYDIFDNSKLDESYESSNKIVRKFEPKIEKAYHTTQVHFSDTQKIEGVEQKKKKKVKVDIDLNNFS